MGKDVANDALFINIASMLSALDFAAPIDDSGNKILPSRTACVDKGLVVYGFLNGNENIADGPSF
jgi:hypothetical protein